MATKKPTAKKTRNPSTKKASSSAPKKTLAEQIAAASSAFNGADPRPEQAHFSSSASSSFFSGRAELGQAP